MKNITTKKWKRNCPKCDDIIYHTSKCNRDRLEKLGLICRGCRGINQRLYSSVNIFQRKCKCGKITTYKTRKNYNQAEKENRLCINCSVRPPCKEETKNKIGKSNSGENNWMFGKKLTIEEKTRLFNQLKPTFHRKHSKDEISKMSLSLRKRYAEKYILLGYKAPRINPVACKFIEEFGKKNGYNFQHALNGGEVYFNDVGAWADGYDKEKNIVFEYDEKHHYDINENLKPKDVRRMEHLKNKLNCLVIRYNEKTRELRTY